MKASRKPILVEAQHFFPVEGEEWPDGIRNLVEACHLVNKEQACGMCGQVNLIHGAVDGPFGKLSVCPDNWVVTNADGEKHVYDAEQFQKMYDIIG